VSTTRQRLVVVVLFLKNIHSPSIDLEYAGMVFLKASVYIEAVALSALACGHAIVGSRQARTAR
jgi:hypothetical protein